MSSVNPFAAGARRALSEALRGREEQLQDARRGERVLRISLGSQALDDVSDMPHVVADAAVTTGSHERRAGAAGAPVQWRIGVDGPERFGYSRLQDFAATLVAAVGHEAQVAVRLPGVEWGLDPLDCLEHFLLGLAAAAGSAGASLGSSASGAAGAASPAAFALVTLQIAEPSERLRAAYRGLLARLLADKPGDWVERADSWPLRCLPPREGLSAGMAYAARLSHDELLTAFVAMPFREDMVDTFEFGILQPAREAGFRAERLDKVAYSGGVLEMIRQRIAAAHVVIADLTYGNPNVFLEIGYAWAKARPTVLIVHQPPTPPGKKVRELKLPFDVSGQKVIVYPTLSALGPELIKHLRSEREQILRERAKQ